MKRKYWRHERGILKEWMENIEGMMGNIEGMIEENWRNEWGILKEWMGNVYMSSVSIWSLSVSTTLIWGIFLKSNKECLGN